MPGSYDEGSEVSPEGRKLGWRQADVCAAGQRAALACERDGRLDTMLLLEREAVQRPPLARPKLVVVWSARHRRRPRHSE